MITKWIQFTVSEESSDAFRAELAVIEAASKAEAGCAHYAAFQSKTDPQVFTVLECWQDAAAFEAHRNAPHIAAFKAKCTAMITEKSALDLAPVA